MTTDAVFTPASSGRTTSRPFNRTVERLFYSGMSILLCVCVFIGFSPTYFQAGVLRAPLPSPILHVHGAVFTLWMLLFVGQAALISARRVNWHRSFGTVAFCLPPVMIVLGLAAAIDALHRGVRIGPLDPAVSFAIPTIGVIGFVVVIYAAWRARRRPDAHKRLVLIATASLVAAAFGRFPWSRIGLPPAAGAVTGLGILLVIIGLHDLMTIRRIHRSTMWAAPLAFGAVALAVPIGMTSAWHAFAALIDRTVGMFI
jgi:putative Mn2+ efflux pump MntP